MDVQAGLRSMENTGTIAHVALHTEQLAKRYGDLALPVAEEVDDTAPYFGYRFRAGKA